MCLLDQLKEFSVVVADTGDLELIRKFRPQDTTTNPSIILKTVTENSQFLQNFLAACSVVSAELIMDSLLIKIGVEILKIIPGRVSTEIDAHLSFDTLAMVNKAHKLIELYHEKEIVSDRVLIKIAATWEGIQAAKILEEEGIHCNMTLIFSLEQAIACAEVGATLISPFVGRILDWYKTNNPEILIDNFDPGVNSVQQIFNYYKKWNYKTKIMAASFRNIDEIIALAGCDLLTISPKLLDALAKMNGCIENKMSQLEKQWKQKIELNEPNFRLSLNENQMVTEKLSEGIRLFCRDIRQLERLIVKQL